MRCLSALFQRPPSKLLVSLSISSSFPVTYDAQNGFGAPHLACLPWWVASGHLSPFALDTAFPCSLDGRNTADYYEDSVTLGLAPRRRSRVPFSTERLEHDVGAPFISLNRFVIDRLSGEGYGAQKSNAPVLTASPGDAVARGVQFHRWG